MRPLDRRRGAARTRGRRHPDLGEPYRSDQAPAARSRHSSDQGRLGTLRPTRCWRTDGALAAGGSENLPCGRGGRTIAASPTGRDQMKARLVLAVAVMIMLAGPALAQSKEAIQKLNDEWAAAFNKGDAGAVAALNTADAYVLPPAAPMVKGRADFQKFWVGAMQHHGDIKLTTLDVKPLGPDAAREIGTATFRTTGANPQDVALKYAVVWQREGGQWKLLQDIWNMDK